MTKYLLPLALIVLSLIVGWQLFRPGYFPMHDDLQVMRVYQMRRCLNDGQLPCRWSPDMGWGYGQPMFNYYSAFPYYLGGLINLIGFSYVGTVKLLFLLSLLVSALFSYLLFKKFVPPAAALVGAAAYLTAPYHALDIFVRGAMAETWALSLLPAVLYAVVLLLEQPGIYRLIFLSLVAAFFTTTHNISLLLSAPIIALFSLLVWWFKGRGIKPLLYLFSTALLALGLSAFFLLPVIVEQGLINTAALTSDYFQYQAHFASVQQLLFSHHWGYGPSKFGVDDDLSFFIGAFQVLSYILALIPLFLFLRRRRYQQVFFLLFAYVLALITLAMTHGKSVYIWDRLPFLKFVQFPWRFLGLNILGTSFLLAFIFSLIPKKASVILSTLTIAAMLLLNFRYFSFEHYWPWVTDDVKLSGELYNLQAKAALADYLPLSASVLPQEPAPDSPEVISGNVNVHYFDKRSNYFSTDIDVFSSSAVIRFPVMYFPDWRIYHNAEPTAYPISINNDLGLITVSLDKGTHRLQGWLEDTFVRKVANLITLSTLGLILFLLPVADYQTGRRCQSQ